MEEKAELRRRILEARRSQSAEDREESSEMIQGHVIGLRVFQEAPCVALFRSMPSEVETETIAAAAFALRKRVFYPTLLEHEHLWFLEAWPGSRFKRHPRGFEVPEEGVPVPASRIGFMLVPGVAFDLKGNRLGMGKGYYDQTLKPANLKVGVAFDLQVVGHVPTEPHDIRLDWLVTETGPTHCAG